MTDWAATVSELATGAGTLVLAVATFAAVRSANRSTRLAEEAMRAGMRPVLMHSRFTDPGQKFAYGDGRWFGLPGGGAVVEATDSVIYLAISIRSTGTGMAILHGWRASPGLRDPLSNPSSIPAVHPPLEEFTAQTRDLYVAPDDVGFWQGALRDPGQERFGAVAAEVKAQGQVYIDLLYGNFEGGERVVSRFNLVYREPSQLGHAAAAPGPAPAEGRWLASVVRHWNVDRPDPR
jgi:hypothetical protein